MLEDLWKGIAIAAIWISLAIICFNMQHIKDYGFIVFMAGFTTMIIVVQ